VPDLTVSRELLCGLSRGEATEIRDVLSAYLGKRNLTSQYAIDTRPPEAGHGHGWELWLVQLTP
jgi:hypothetical protein